MERCCYCGKPFAEFYDSILEGDPYAEKYYQIVNRFIEKYNPTARKILELAVGTGNVIGKFPSQKFELHGLDISENYLKIAREKYPHIKYYKQDMSSFQVGEKFDVIFLIFDAINWLTSFSKWESLFDRVKEHLNPNGLFIFNTYSKRALNLFKKWENYSITKFSKGIMFDKPSVKRNTLTWEVLLFEKAENHIYQLHRYELIEKIYSLTTIKRALSKRLQILEILDEETGGKVTPKTFKIIFVCQERENTKLKRV
ncbi:MAG: hypothetical protein DRN99_05785 [Thermoproteota archaeon]|nr:MAG: hypothetical protein DRN99_05785 [Candidatus Korarchaeota archaeon]